MASADNVLQTRNQLTTNYDTSKLLLGFNHFIEGDITASGADVVIEQGQLMGRVSSTQKLVPLDSNANDGSELPVGIAIVSQTIVSGTTKKITLVNKGKVDANKIVFTGSDNLDTLVGSRSLKDHLNYLGVILEYGLELTDFDN